uniref:SFRICE_036670 n=1 Tax=Spodoptera frugiperda TaxID=7108 RepID=A0A2H1W5M9_SPOFR
MAGANVSTNRSADRALFVFFLNKPINEQKYRLMGLERGVIGPPVTSLTQRKCCFTSVYCEAVVSLGSSRLIRAKVWLSHILKSKSKLFISNKLFLTARLVRWLGNWLPRNVYRVQFPHGATLCVIHKLLFRVWVSCVSMSTCMFVNAPTTREKILVWCKIKKKKQKNLSESKSSQNNLFQIDQEGTFERQSKYNKIINVCLSVSPLVALFARSKSILIINL